MALNPTCFVCLKQFHPLNNASINSLRHIFHYLKMTKEKIFTDNCFSEINLCLDCEQLNEEFSDLYNELEVIKLKAESCLEMISTKILIIKDEQEGLGKIREQLMTICTSKCRRLFPRLELRRLGSKDVKQESNQIPKVMVELTDNEDLDNDHFISGLSPPASPGRGAIKRSKSSINEEYSKRPKLETRIFTNQVKAPPSPTSECRASRSRSLRNIQRCNNCHKTFSSAEKLKDHLRTCKTKAVIENDNDNESETGDVEDVEDLNLSSSSDEEQESERNTKRRRKSSVKNQSEPSEKKLLYRYKCPECSYLYLSNAEVINHYLETHSDSTSGLDLTKSAITVDILAFKDGSNIPELIENDNQADHELFIRLEVPLKPLFICPNENCERSFESEEQLQSHSKLHGLFKCHLCHLKFNYGPNLTKHEFNHGRRERLKHKISSFACLRCEEKFKSSIDRFYHHLNQHLSLKLDTPTCLICKKKGEYHNFKKDSDWLNHYKYFHDTKDLGAEFVVRCKEVNCNAYFQRDMYLANHLRDEHNVPQKTAYQRAFWCGICNKGCKDPRYLTKHRNYLHKNDPRMLSCEKCTNPLFENEAELQRHNFMHHFEGKDSLECPKCKIKVAGTKGVLEAHLKSHLRDEGKLPPRKPIVKMDDITERRYVCDICGKSFKIKIGLSYHTLQVHTSRDEWEFKCEICGKKFAFKTALAIHKRSHTKERPYVCQICGKAYSHRTKLRTHNNKMHGDVIQDIPQKRDLTNMKRKNENSGMAGMPL